MHEAHMLTLLRQIRDCMCFSFSSHHISLTFSWTFRLPLISLAPSRPGRHVVIWTLAVLEGNNKWDDRPERSTGNLAVRERRFGACVCPASLLLEDLEQEPINK